MQVLCSKRFDPSLSSHPIPNEKGKESSGPRTGSGVSFVLLCRQMGNCLLCSMVRVVILRGQGVSSPRVPPTLLHSFPDSPSRPVLPDPPSWDPCLRLCSPLLSSRYILPQPTHHDAWAVLLMTRFPEVAAALGAPFSSSSLCPDPQILIFSVSLNPEDSTNIAIFLPTPNPLLLQTPPLPFSHRFSHRGSKTFESSLALPAVS